MDTSSQVVTSSGEEVFFKIKRNTKLSKLQGAYANKVGKDVSTIRCAHLLSPPPRVGRLMEHRRFLYDGQRISEEDTPNSLDMEDNGARCLVSVCVRP
jgi:hypothetical protein